jgi:hypothetical protein
MPDTIDSLISNWSNQRARPLADSMTRMLTALQAYQADWAAFGLNAAVVAAGNTNKIGDGYTVDGRQPVTGLQLQNFKAAIDQLVIAWNVTAVTGVGATPQAIQQAIQVNGSAR